MYNPNVLGCLPKFKLIHQSLIQMYTSKKRFEVYHIKKTPIPLPPLYGRHGKSWADLTVDPYILLCRLYVSQFYVVPCIKGLYWSLCVIKQSRRLSFYLHTVHLDIIKVFYLPTDAQENCFKIYIKIYIKTAPTCFGTITIIREGIIRAYQSYSY
jgi:hypothetical protein